MIDLEADLRALYVAGNGVGAAMLALTPLPYVGPAFKVLRKLVSTSVKVLVKPSRDGLTKFNKAITKPTKSRLQELLIKNEAAATALEVAADLYGEYFEDPMRYADMSCGAVTTCTVCQPAVTQGLAAVNGVLDGIADEVTAIATALKKISGFLVEVSSFVLSKGWQKFSNFLSGLDKLLAPFYNLLNKKICVTVPVPTIKKKCKKVFGKRICIKYPTVVKEKFCFRVQQIIDGLNVMSLIMDYLMKALKKHIPGLDIEKQLIKLFPSLNALPGVPDVSLPNFNLPALPYVDLGFAAGECVSALTEVTDGGVPEIVNMVDQCFELPNLPSFPMSICDNTCSS